MTDSPHAKSPTDADADAAADDQAPASEALEVARARKHARIDSKWVAAGVATGIGSAALVAALLYSGRNKGPKSGK